MKIFIGSSKEIADSELLEIAGFIKNQGIDTLLWNQKPSIFKLSKGMLENLEELIDRENICAAVFIFSKDDKTWIRGEMQDVVRDNVLFEYGLFTGILGREKVIAVKTEEDIKIPSDLYGIKTISYNKNKHYAGLDIKKWIEQLREIEQVKKQEKIIPEVKSVINEFRSIIEDAKKNKVFTEYISGEKDAFAALTNAINGAKESVRSTRFSPFTVVDNQKDFFMAMLKAANNGIKLKRIITVNSKSKINEVVNLLNNSVNKEFTLYLTDIEYGFELVIIDEREVFIHFRKDNEKDKLITSTLHMEQQSIAEEFAKIFDDLSKNNIESFECKKLEAKTALEETKKIHDIFDKHANKDSVNE